jgi:hypothetical protein
VHTEDFSFIGDCSQQHCFYATSTPAEMFDLFCSAFHVVGTPSFMHTKLHTDVESYLFFWEPHTETDGCPRVDTVISTVPEIR